MLSFVRLAQTPKAINQVRIDTASADALIGCDVVVSSSPKASATYHSGTKAVLNLAEMPTGDIVRHRDASLRVDHRRTAIEAVVGEANLASFDANRLAEKLLGDTVFANVIMLGAAWQNGLVPVSLGALMQATELNGVAIETNKSAFALGRIMIAAPERLVTEDNAQDSDQESTEAVVGRFAEFLRGYQDQAYADRYMGTVNKVRALEEGHGSAALTKAVVKSLFRLMAYKDEYEVARLHRDRAFRDRLAGEFEPGFKVTYNLAPPLLNGETDARGRPLKREFGSWMSTVFSGLKRLKGLRGGLFDPFGRTEERRMERELIGWYEALVDESLLLLNDRNVEQVTALLALGDQIRGYGPVKEEAVAQVKALVEDRLTELRQPEALAA